MNTAIKTFVSYVMGFYGPAGIYPEFDFTFAEVEGATKIYMRDQPDFCGDSLDRERVRDLVVKLRATI
jgi:hypothetical protein